MSQTLHVLNTLDTVRDRRTPASTPRPRPYAANSLKLAPLLGRQPLLTDTIVNDSLSVRAAAEADPAFYEFAGKRLCFALRAKADTFEDVLQAQLRDQMDFSSLSPKLRKAVAAGEVSTIDQFARTREGRRVVEHVRKLDASVHRGNVLRPRFGDLRARIQARARDRVVLATLPPGAQTLAAELDARVEEELQRRKEREPDKTHAPTRSIYTAVVEAAACSDLDKDAVRRAIVDHAYGTNILSAGNQEVSVVFAPPRREREEAARALVGMDKAVARWVTTKRVAIRGRLPVGSLDFKALDAILEDAELLELRKVVEQENTEPAFKQYVDRVVEVASRHHGGSTARKTMSLVAIALGTGATDLALEVLLPATPPPVQIGLKVVGLGSLAVAGFEGLIHEREARHCEGLKDGWRAELRQEDKALGGR